MNRFTAYIEKDVETGYYVAIVPGISGVHTLTDTLDELQARLKEVIELCLEEIDPEDKGYIPEFVGLQQIEVTV
ncbi:type II toxin-antitoxin system HicB family antitoxin [Methanolobus vulcani]|uniref:Type II toxin-antitoxin system HicB family antitoxin n=1 Tax=Methanolobus vulcani TaxID=38026 RepID=A0A7Z8KL53_9EURY|nr:type II toxin-antitoxin system HicB family antitoxin [Methanolobus vulcani]TQD23397.1 type II toxin-antitoxin system HicB family antitoxin [Methanolobus vulcani]